jgi:hypothetical protein
MVSSCAAVEATVIVIKALDKVFQNSCCFGGFTLTLGCGLCALLLECGLLRWFLELGLDIGEFGDALPGGHSSQLFQDTAGISVDMLRFDSAADLVDGAS